MFKVELVEGDSSFQDIEKWYNYNEYELINLIKEIEKYEK